MQIVHLSATSITRQVESIQLRAGFVTGFPKTAASRQCLNFIPDREGGPTEEQIYSRRLLGPSRGPTMKASKWNWSLHRAKMTNPAIK